jgi:Tol biopolymer transport system component
MGHYLMNHMWMGLGFAVLMILIFAYLTHRLMGGIIARHSRRLGFDRLSSLASLPLLYLALLAFGFLLAPIQNAVSRDFEHEADVFGMEVTGNAVAAEGAFEKLANVNLSNPEPSTFIKLWRYSHPPLGERVRFVRSYDGGGKNAAAAHPDPLGFPGEKHLSNIRQLTNGGENAEAYFNAPGDRLIFQSTRGDWPCDRIFTMTTEGEELKQISPGKGVTTCAFWAPNGEKIIYASTHLVDDSCPPRPDYSQGYVWPLHKGYDIFIANPDGSDLRRLTSAPGYDAEAVYSPDGSKILFTSVRDGDLELYTMDTKGGNVVRLTHEVGYDGGAFFSADGTKICYRAHHPTDSAEVADYKRLLDQGLIRPSHLEVFVMDADGSNKRQVTDNGAANFCPFFHPSGEKIIFASNMGDPSGRSFDLYMINVDGTGLEQVTYNESFDGFPMFNADGTKLVWCSNRHNRERGETNTFIADWTDWDR